MKKRLKRPWLKPAPFGYWENSENRQAAYEWAEQFFNVKKPEDWYNIKRRQFIGVGLFPMLYESYNGNFINFLKI